MPNQSQGSNASLEAEQKASVLAKYPEAHLLMWKREKDEVECWKIYDTRKCENVISAENCYSQQDAWASAADRLAK